MSGKSYTMTEMKAIVDYLAENKAYGEFKGRKMWMNFANSKATKRTWQSLKETFLKRILPDIHNPYYGLSMTQIRSFRQGFDVKEREKSTLEFEPVAYDSNSNDENRMDNDVPSTSTANNKGKSTGEKSITSKINSRDRDSVDTIIIGSCYETAEDLQRELESPVTKNEEKKTKSPHKSLRDLITFSEPLTPIIQNIVHDFATEDSDDEPRMQIVEKDDSDTHMKSPEKAQSFGNETNNVVEENVNNDESNNSDNFIPPKIKSLRLRKKQSAVGNKPYYGIVKGPNDEKTKEDMDKTITKSFDCLKKNVSEYNVQALSDLNSGKENKEEKNSKLTTQNCSNSTTDTLLPDNQEALAGQKPLETQSFDKSNNVNYQDNTPLNTENNKETVEKGTKINTNDFNEVVKHDKTSSQSDSTSKKNLSNMEQKTNIEINGNANSNSITESQFNPCLQSVSLFAEQFIETNYRDTDSSEPENVHTNNVEENLNKINKKDLNMSKDVVILKSHSETDSEVDQAPIKKKNSQPVKSQRERAFANLFGFSSEGVTTKRKRRTSYKRMSGIYNRMNASSDSSEWTSENDNGYVSPPRGRKNRRARKYLKPKSARIHSLEDEGGTFVMYRNKIYPLSRDGKYYLTHLPESDPEEENNYWKQKYVEEKKRVATLKELIEQEKLKRVGNESPVIPRKAIKQQAENHEPVVPPINVEQTSNDQDVLHIPDEGLKNKVVNTQVDKTLKITLTKNDQQVHLEGHWSQLHPVLGRVFDIFHKDPEVVKEPAKPMDMIEQIEIISDKSSVKSGHFDEDAHNKINEIEAEIFKEIEKQDQAEEVEEKIVSKENIDRNVTKRKRANKAVASKSNRKSNEKQSSPDSSQNPKRSKTTERSLPDSVSNTRNVLSASTIDSPISTEKRKANKTPKKDSAVKEPVKVTTTEVRTRPKRLRITEEKDKQFEEKHEESPVRYMLPPTNRRSTRNSSGKDLPSGRYIITVPNIYRSPNVSLNSESTQGYLDSDVSPPKYLVKKRRKLSLSTVSYRNKQYRLKRRSLPIITYEDSSTSNNSSNLSTSHTANLDKNDLTLKSDEYKSDSYQLLMPKRKVPYVVLEKIDEDCVLPIVKTDNLSKMNNDDTAVVSNSNKDENSSNVSLPLSPELSLVENLSLSQDMVLTYNNPTLNEIQEYKSENITHDKFIISQVDVSMPLMQQKCGVHRSFPRSIKSNYSYSEHMKLPDSEVIGSENMEEGTTMSDSLDTRLKNLFLESAKKVSAPFTEINNVNEIKVASKKGKRCSTPRKKSAPKKTSNQKIASVVEAECTQSFSCGGRNSCPPAIHVIKDTEQDENIPAKISSEDKKVKKKKDVIKVKILRPRESSRTRNKSPKESDVGNKKCAHGDSGINETIISTNSSIDLIHNHSETCLQVNECFSDSVEIMETNSKSIISISSNSPESNDQILKSQIIFQDCLDFLPDMFSNNVQDVTDAFNNVSSEKKEVIDNNSDTVYHSPKLQELSLNSLITEDLSDESPTPSQSNNWYLLSEDETNNPSSCLKDFGLNSSTHGANLKQLFPVTCSVPDLSTITETSKENDENSRKGSYFLSCDTNTMNDFDSQNLFDIQ